MNNPCDFPDVGYSPNNLRELMRRKGLTRRMVANYLSVSPRTVSSWLASENLVTHHDMPYYHWVSLQKHDRKY